MKQLTRRLSAAAAALFMGLGLMLLAAPSASAASGTITGTIQCGYGNNQVVGVWVDATTGNDGFASVTPGSNGGYNYQYTLSQSSSYMLYVGCSGTSSSWGSSMESSRENGQYYDWTCTYGAGTGFKYRCTAS